MSQDRLRSTGRKPSLDTAGVVALLERYMDGSNVSIADLASERKLTQATVRKYLKAAGLVLPRGRAALQPREPVSARSLVNAMPTAILIGDGRAELLRRRIEAGESMTALATAFGISRDRVRRFRAEAGLAPAAEAPEASVESASEPAVEAADPAVEA